MATTTYALEGHHPSARATAWSWEAYASRLRAAVAQAVAALRQALQTGP